MKGAFFRALSSTGPKFREVAIETCVMVDERTVIKPDVVVFEKRGLDPFTMECVPCRASGWPWRSSRPARSGRIVP